LLIMSQLRLRILRRAKPDLVASPEIIEQAILPRYGHAPHGGETPCG